MKLKHKGSGDAVHMSHDAAMVALASGDYEAQPIEGERGPDQPGAQAPAPGVDPVGGEEGATDGSVLTNMTPVAGAAADGGLPVEPKEPATDTTKAPVGDKPVPVAPAPAPTTAAPAKKV